MVFIEYQSMTSINYLHYDPVFKQTHLMAQNGSVKPGKPLDHLEAWANVFGLGVLGSQSAFRRRLCIRQKIPVLIDPYRQVYFFPTQSPLSAACVWINASQVKSIKTVKLESRIVFLDGSWVILPVGRRSLMKQWQRCQTMEQLILRHHLQEQSIQPNFKP